MTDRDDHRAQCIKAVKVALAIDALFSTIDDDRTATAAFDALDGIVLVLRAGMFDRLIDEAFYRGHELREIITSETLTKPPEAKP